MCYYIEKYESYYTLISYNFKECDEVADMNYNHDHSFYYGVEFRQNSIKRFYNSDKEGVKCLSRIEISKNLFDSLMKLLDIQFNLFDSKLSMLFHDKGVISYSTSTFIKIDGWDISLNKIYPDDIYTEFKLVDQHGGDWYMAPNKSEKYNDEGLRPCDYGSETETFIREGEYNSLLYEAGKIISTLFNIISAIYNDRLLQSKVIAQ